MSIAVDGIDHPRYQMNIPSSARWLIPMICGWPCRGPLSSSACYSGAAEEREFKIRTKGRKDRFRSRVVPVYAIKSCSDSGQAQRFLLQLSGAFWYVGNVQSFINMWLFFTKNIWSHVIQHIWMSTCMHREYINLETATADQLLMISRFLQHVTSYLH